ncbi:MAG: hypothetical protein H0W40_07865 [Methylibium sp.]|uniref:hypothetical protein n=1 Tax=Methylibium sp. TaxID=2067992 RepID=UPI0017A8BAC3|nr:hypothetical protein [Methylibium sp.]MBA3597278.1 hypothetical protein [Methylibium sp.]
MLSSPASPGRSCPLHYRYAPGVFARTDELRAEVLYVVGGLYGNLSAWREAVRLLAVEERAAGAGRVALVLNGDFHWFDADAGWFGEVERETAGHLRLRGNVETEIADPEAGAGCGCAYPQDVSDAVVERSNRIIERLRTTARELPGVTAALAALPMHAVARVGETRWGLVHGDAESLAGWGFDPAALGADERGAWIERALREAEVDGFASSHTCAPALRAFTVDGRERLIINNGAAGMPNFAGTRAGVITRIGTSAPPDGLPVLYGRTLRGVQVHAIALHYDHAAFLRRFLAVWPEGSDAHASYFARIVDGPDWCIAQALGAREARA